MLENAATAVVLLLFLSAAVERGVEVAMTALETTLAPSSRLLAAVTLSTLLGLAIAFGLQLDLVSALLAEDTLTPSQGRGVTAIALAGGSGPAHELIRLLEEAKGRLKAPAN